MNAIVAGQRDIIVPRNTLPELEASHHDRIIQDFHMIDPGKRQLLRQITSERLPHRSHLRTEKPYFPRSGHARKNAGNKLKRELMGQTVINFKPIAEKGELPLYFTKLSV